MAGPGTDTSAGSSAPGAVVAVGGTGIGVIGTSFSGPAFVPISILDINGFITRFGPISAKHFGVLAAQAWLQYSSGCTFLKLLGIGDGNKRIVAESTNSDAESISAGAVKNSGFVVGSRMTGSNGLLQSNPYAVPGGLPGRTFFLGAFMSESAGSTYFSAAGIQKSAISAPILRGVLFAASGVLPALSGCYTGNASTASAGATVGSFDIGNDGGSTVGSINISNGSEKFVLLLNGHIETSEYPNKITASMNVNVSADDGTSLYFADVFNTDPLKIQESGHYLHTRYDIESAQGVVTGSGIVAADKFITDIAADRLEESIFLLTSSIVRNANDSVGSLAIPNFENFCDRYQTAKTPMIISQRFDGVPYNLFRFHSLNDGTFGGSTIKITIENLAPGEDDDEYGTFDVNIRSINNLDSEITPVSGSEKYTGCNLNPASDQYIAKVIGDNHFYYNWDAKHTRQRFINNGNNHNRSAFIRVEVSTVVKDQNIPVKTLPMGFRGVQHLVTSGSSILSNPQHPLGTGVVISSATEWGNRVVEPPIPYRLQIGDEPDTAGVATGTKDLNSDLCWGVQTTRFNTVKKPNTLLEQNVSIPAYQTWFPNFTTSRQKAWVGDNTGVTDSSGTIYDADRYNNDKFSLENILVHTRSDANIVDNTQWAYAQYRRDRVKIPLTDSTTKVKSGVRFFDPGKDLSKSSINEFAKFTLLLQGGFDGFNIFSKEKKYFSNLAAYFEMQDENQGQKRGSVVAAYLKALSMLEEKTESTIKLFAIPGIRIEAITNPAIQIAEERFDAFYVMDIEEVASGSGLVVTGSEEIDTTLTADRFRSRAMDTSFVAVYFPDIQMLDPQTTQSVFTPPSISAIRVLSRLDAAGSVSAPAGTIRGVIDENAAGWAVQSKVKFDSEQKSTIKTLYDVAINPIISGEGGMGPILFGQRTLLTSADTMLQRISVRRMVLEIRRLVREAAKSFLFQQNKEQVLMTFETTLKPILQQMVNAGGVSAYKITIDTSTTTQVDIESNIVRGRVFLQPTKSDEIIQVDFST